MYWFLIIFAVIHIHGEALPRTIVVSTTPFQTEKECVDTMNDVNKQYQQMPEANNPPHLHFICSQE